MVLPLVAGVPGDLLQELPFLAEKKYLVWDGDPDAVVRELRGLRKRQQKFNALASEVEKPSGNAIEELLSEERSTRFQLNTTWQQLRTWREHSPEQRDQIEIFEDEVRSHEQRLADIRRQLGERGYSSLT